LPFSYLLIKKPLTKNECALFKAVKSLR